MKDKKYAYDVVLKSPLTGQFYFCPKVQLHDGYADVVGKKIDVTKWLQPYLLKKHRLETPSTDPEEK